MRPRQGSSVGRREQVIAEVKKRVVTLVDSTYQPTKAEFEEPIVVPDGKTADDLVVAIMRPVEIQRTQRPE